MPKKSTIIGHISITQRHQRPGTFGMLLQFPMLHSWLLSSQLQTDWQRNKLMPTSFWETWAAPFPAAQHESQCCLSLASCKRFCTGLHRHHHLPPEVLPLLVIFLYDPSCPSLKLRHCTEQPLLLLTSSHKAIGAVCAKELMSCLLLDIVHYIQDTLLAASEGDTFQ